MAMIFDTIMLILLLIDFDFKYCSYSTFYAHINASFVALPLLMLYDWGSSFQFVSVFLGSIPSLSYVYFALIFTIYNFLIFEFIKFYTCIFSSWTNFNNVSKCSCYVHKPTIEHMIVVVMNRPGFIFLGKHCFVLL